MKRTSYNINEIFYSLQGEGYYTGTAAVFLRFSGCNRRCSFCDTDFSASTPMSLDMIMERVCAYPARHIVLTGGEPTLQVDDALVAALKSAGFYIQIETNGTMPVPTGIDWVTCSPKEAPWHINRIDELKVVFTGGDDVERISALLPAPRHYLQPLSGGNISQTVDYIKSHPHWRLSLQTHKLIAIP